MTIFICLDDADGLAFNHRRQSRDRVLCEHIAALSQKSVLRMNTSSFSLFSGINAPNICAEDDFMQHAQPDDFCFLECADPTPYLGLASCLTVFRWNRRYPADLHFSVPEGWKKVRETEFEGSSHPTITQEDYVKCEN
ncbi:MAG: ribonuclease Z [Agathobaculum sp.]|mgnify:FL=1|uniref:ribonuclease Z n=1 Tax=Agathobaculum sp. TaxID=2048138 RepID=UPI002EBDA9D9|nr:ribonuclease Z [Agathobaculum sp.]